jgi:hypothetical protein
VELSNKTLLMLLRSTDNFIFASRSTDRGKHWSKPLKTTVNNPDSKLSALRLSSGLHTLAFNDHFRAFTGHAKVSHSPPHSITVRATPTFSSRSQAHPRPQYAAVATLQPKSATGSLSLCGAVGSLAE